MTLRSSTIRIAAVGDVALMQRPSSKLWRSVLDAADARIANLEGPITTDTSRPAEKLIRLRLPPESAGWLKELGTTAVSLSNNHLMDWGAGGLDDTLRALGQAGVMYTGAGRDAGEAAKPAILEVGGYKIALLSWASTIPTGFRATDVRPGIAGVRIRTSLVMDPGIADEQPGTPPWVRTEPLPEDLGRLEDSVRQARAAADCVILAMHWGVPPQWSSAFQGPVAEYQAAVARRAAAAGVSAIVGHHCHAPYGIEVIDAEGAAGAAAVPVLYSLGNYIFHPEYQPGGLDFSPGLLPYKATLLPENHQSCAAMLELKPAAEGLRVARVTLHPAIMNEVGEAVALAEAEALPIAERLRSFSEARGTRVRVEGGAMVWEAAGGER